ncbi:MAG: 4Fe-4S binding protein, partial [Clostridia bacterium]|nr:4Fe-4S binding protein [Clostridia bacterium]
MSAYILNDLEKCIGCGLCQGSCANGAITIVDGKATIDQNTCILCKVCIDACPVGALSLKSDAADTASDTAASRGIWVFAEMGSNAPESVGFELTGKAFELAQ